MIEIERKFLVKNLDFIKESYKHTRIVQGFLNTDPYRTVRIRVKGDKGFITVKGIGNQSGTSRFEWEKEIPLCEAEALLQLCEPFPIDKIRYEVKFKNFLYEIDVFSGENEGLILAEIELNSENQYFEKPSWIGEEVTGQKEYYNSYLSKYPLKKSN